MALAVHSFAHSGKQALHDKVDTLWLTESQVVSQDTIAEAQRAYCRHPAKACANALPASLHDGMEDGKRACARLLSCACRPTSAWLDTLPLKHVSCIHHGIDPTPTAHVDIKDSSG
jgi:hypothetical protein